MVRIVGSLIPKTRLLGPSYQYLCDFESLRVLAATCADQCRNVDAGVYHNVGIPPLQGRHHGRHNIDTRPAVALA